MENSVFGWVTTFALIFIFLIGFTNFIIMFPAEQGFEFSESDNDTYVTLQKMNIKQNVTSSLDNIENQTDTGWKNFDVEVGFMGSNTQKSTESDFSTYLKRAVATLKIIANQVFTTESGSLHPVMVVIGIITSLIGILSVLIFYKFIRTGT